MDLSGSGAALTDRGAAERRNMSVSNVMRNMGTLLLPNQITKYQKDVQKSFVVLGSLSEKQSGITGNKTGISENSSMFHRFVPYVRRQLLQECASGENMVKDADLSENIRQVGETAGKLQIQSLLAEKTSCTYQMKDGTEVSYFTFYEKERIYCKKEGTDDCEWEIPLEDEAQYEKVISFLNEMENKEDLSCMIHKTFWQDFLSGELNINEFRDFLNTRIQEGTLDAPVISEDGEVLNREAAKYSIYTYGAAFGTVIARTTEEFLQWQEEQCNKVYDEIKEKGFIHWYYEEHPDEIGKKNQYYNGRWMTMAECYLLCQKDLKELFLHTKEVV